MNRSPNRLVLLMHCPDQKGIIASVTEFIHQQNGNIIYIDQYVDRSQDAFFMRMVVEDSNKTIDFNAFKNDFALELGAAFQLKCDFYQEERLPKMAIFVSK